MIRLLSFILFISLYSCDAQNDFVSNIEFTTDMENFENLAAWKEALKDVDIVALGENTHGLGEVFTAKTELVKFLHEEMGFDLILFESGFGDGALAWEQIDQLTASEFTLSFTSNFYYKSHEIENLVSYIKSQDQKLKIQGFDCQPQQDFLIRRMKQITEPVDSIFSASIPMEMRSFNNLYQFENDKDTLAFNDQRDRFTQFLSDFNSFLNDNVEQLVKSGTTQNEIDILKKSNDIFINTYSKIRFGDMMGWPTVANIRDKAMFDIVKWYKEKNPDTKIIIWAQNSHIENQSQPNSNVHWMGHQLKETYGDKYYSLGSIVYSGKNMTYNGTFDFEHNDQTYLAYHLNQVGKEQYVFDLRNYSKNDFIDHPYLGMENNGNTSQFVARDRFDGLLFIRHSVIPTLIKLEK